MGFAPPQGYDGNPLVLTALASDPAAISSAGQYYTKVVSGIAEAHYADSNGAVTQITSNGAINAGELGGNPTFTTVGIGAAKSAAEILSVTATGSIASAASAVWSGIHFKTATATISGSTNITTATGFNLIQIEAPALVGTMVVTNSGALVLAGPPTMSGGGSITNPYTLWIQSGVSRHDGAITAGASAPTAGSVRIGNDSDDGTGSTGIVWKRTTATAREWSMFVMSTGALAIRDRTGSATAWTFGAGAGGLLSSSNLRFAHGTSALATTATDGYLFIQSCAGTPTGVPSNIPTGQIAMVYDTTANKLWFYTGGAWKRGQVSAVDTIWA